MGRWISLQISSISWHDRSEASVITGDYDGVVSVYDVQRGENVFEGYEHDGQRIWGLASKNSMVSPQAIQNLSGLLLMFPSESSLFE